MTKAIRWDQATLDEFQRKRKAPATLLGPDPAPKPAKKAKYASQKVEYDGQKFDSKKEARRWAELEMQQACGEIRDLKRQVPFELAPAVRLEGEARKKPAIRYWGDFTYVQNGQLVVEDVKSKPTRKLPAFRLKKHLMATVLGIHIKET